MTTSFTNALSLAVRLLTATCSAALGTTVLLAAPGCETALCDEFGTELTFTLEASTTTATLRSVAVETTGRAVAVGDGGVLLTRDPAGTWQAQDSTVTTDLHAVAVAVDDARAIAVGAGGVVLISHEGGTWVSVPTGVTADLHGITFLDEGGVIVVGDGVLLRSEDLGLTWASVEVPATAMLRAAGARREYDWETGTTRIVEILAVGQDGVAFSSPDVGETWQAVATGVSEDLRAIAAMQGSDDDGEREVWLVLGTQTLLRGDWIILERDSVA